MGATWDKTVHFPGHFSEWAALEIMGWKRRNRKRCCFCQNWNDRNEDDIRWWKLENDGYSIVAQALKREWNPFESYEQIIECEIEAAKDPDLWALYACELDFTLQESALTRYKDRYDTVTICSQAIKEMMTAKPEIRLKALYRAWVKLKGEDVYDTDKAYDEKYMVQE